MEAWGSYMSVLNDVDVVPADVDIVPADVVNIADAGTDVGNQNAKPRP